MRFWDKNKIEVELYAEAELLVSKFYFKSTKYMHVCILTMVKKKTND